MKLYSIITMRIALVQLMVVQPALSGEPSWSKDMPRLVNKLFQVSCHGLGPDKAIAYQQAQDQCRSIAANHLGGTFKVKTMSMESEEDAGFHQEVIAKNDVHGLFCDVKNSQEEEIDGSYHVYLRCSFDTSLVKIVPKIQKQEFAAKLPVKSPKRNLIVSSVPHCNSIVVAGDTMKMVRCTGNPQVVTVDGSTSHLVVRAKGYQPKEVEIEDQETLEVYLDRN
jgi:hypothetical protein